MRLIVEDGLTPDMEGYETQEQLRRVFEASMNLSAAKSKHYGSAWKQQGWMGNLARVMSKVARLKNMCWVDFPVEDSKETVADTAQDLVNLAAFFLVNKADGNRWGV